jgi:protein transport protein SEC61 subunit gamma-like protein
MKVWGRIKVFWVECKRVLRITKKPNKEEFITIVKVSGLGILAIGLIGFIFHMIYQFIKPG